MYEGRGMMYEGRMPILNRDSTESLPKPNRQHVRVMSDLPYCCLIAMMLV